MIQSATLGSLKMASIDAVKIAASGERADLGLVSYWHRNPLMRWLWRWGRMSLAERLALLLTVAAVCFLLLCASHISLLPTLVLATVFTHAGKAIVTNRLIGAGTEPKFVAWGTGAGTAAAGDTTLFTEAAEARTSGTSSRVTTAQANDTYQVVGLITSLSGQTITNAGLFDAAAAGNLLVKGDFAGVPLAIGEAIQFTTKLQFS